MKETTARILKLMSDKKISAYRLCKDCGIPTSSFSQIKNKGTVDWKVDHLKAIARYFKVSLDWLVNGEKATVTVNKSLEKQIYKFKKENTELREQLKDYEILKKAIDQIKS